MALIEWSNSLRVSVQEFDAHHEHLVELLNKIHDIYSCGESDKEIGNVIDELIDYAGYHFAAEEHWMTWHSYPKRAEHKAEHDSFLPKVMEFRRNFHAGTTALTEDIFTFLVEWLTTHIMGSDKDYGRFVAAAASP